MKNRLFIALAAFALAFAVTPAAFAQQAAVPSVRQQGNVVIEERTALPDGTEIITSAAVEGMDSESLRVYVVGTTDVDSDAEDASGEARIKGSNSLAAAQATGSTMASMLKISPDLVDAGLTSENNVVSVEFYLGIQDLEGKPHTGDVTVVLRLASADEAGSIAMVLYYDEVNNRWLSVPFTCAGEQIILITRRTGVYRFVSRVK